ncbi:MAG: Mpo1-like protein [Planctomycetota bacterium]
MSERFPTFRSFEEFWPFYVGEHRRPLCRALHYLGALCALAILVWAIWTGTWLGLALAVVVGYGFAWIGHFLVEHNTPATWGYVRWSFMAELKMVGLALTGRMRREVERLDAHRDQG